MLTPREAFDLQSQVVERVAVGRSSWIGLAACLEGFHAGRGWQALGIDSFNEWLGQPEVSISRSDAYAMIGAWRELVVGRDVDPAVLARLDVGKVAVVLPAIRSGDVEVEDALADCEALSRSDLRAQYVDSSAAEYRVCEACGQKVRITRDHG